MWMNWIVYMDDYVEERLMWMTAWMIFLGGFTDEWLKKMCMHLCMARIRCTSVWYNRLFVFSLPPLSPNPIPSPFLSPFLFLTFLSIYLCSASVPLSVFNPCRKGRLETDRRNSKRRDIIEVANPNPCFRGKLQITKEASSFSRLGLPRSDYAIATSPEKGEDGCYNRRRDKKVEIDWWQWMSYCNEKSLRKIKVQGKFVAVIDSSN